MNTQPISQTFDLLSLKFHNYCHKKLISKPVENANVTSDAKSSLDNESSTGYSKSNYIRGVINKENGLNPRNLSVTSPWISLGNSSYRHKLTICLKTLAHTFVSTILTHTVQPIL